MSEATIRAAIVALVDAVTGVGPVYGRRRWVAEVKDVKSLFVESGHLNVWFVRRKKTPAGHATQGPSHESRRHTFHIEGFYGLDDAADSEETFTTIVERVCTAIRGNYRLSGTCFDNGPANVEDQDYRMLAGVLCHYALVSVEAEELESC